MTSEYGDMVMLRRSVAVLLVAILGFSILIHWNTSEVMKKPEVRVPIRHAAISYIPHEPFNVTSDEDFETQSWPGNGTQTNPYRIENLNITSNSSACIWIMNTTSFFNIQNCLFTSSIQEYTPYYPINTLTLTNVSNCEIIGNQIIESPTGISAYSLSNCRIVNNQFNVSWTVIEARLCNFTTITNNNQEFDSCAYGISIFGSRNCMVSQNSFPYVRSHGIVAGAIHFSNFTKNTIIVSEPVLYDWKGILLQGGEHCLINDNEIVGVDQFHCGWECLPATGIDISGYGHIVENNKITLNRYGILVNANTAIIRRNNLTDNYVSIELAIANDTDIYENSMRGYESKYETGISISNGFGCNIYSNIISHVGYGIVLQGASGFNIFQNIVYDSRYGIKFSWTPNWYYASAGPSFDCDIIGNSFDTGGIYPNIEHYDSWDFETIHFLDNTVNGRRIGFFANLDNETIDASNLGQLFLVNCHLVEVIRGNFYDVTSDIGEGIYYDPGQASAILLLNCTNCELFDVRFRNNTIGVIIQDSSQCKIHNALGSFNSWAGLILWHSENIFIDNVYFTNNRKGIASGWSWNCRIFNCILWDNEEAIILGNSANHTIYRNIIFQNSDGIFLAESYFCNILRNEIYLNSRGILLNDSSDCLISRNQVYNNTGAGISLDLTSHRNTIYDNTFAHNSPNAICFGTSNIWDDQVETGNWWSDYTGDGPYIIDEDDQDNFPIYNESTTTSTTPISQWQFEPLILGVAAGIIGIFAVLVVIIDRRRVKIID